MKNFGILPLIVTLLAVGLLINPALADSDPYVICRDPADSGRCHAMFPKWYYNIKENKCEQFDYGGCGGNQNKFESKEQCEKRCGPAGTHG